MTKRCIANTSWMAALAILGVIVSVISLPIARAAAEEKLTLKVVKVDSEETSGEDGKGANAVDGDKANFWHTQWQDASPPCPHYIIVDCGKSVEIKGFVYVPRQEGENGRIKDYEFYVSGEKEKDKMGTAVAKGTWPNSADDQKVMLKEPKKGQYFMLLATSEQADQAWTSVAELSVITDGAAGGAEAAAPAAPTAPAATGGAAAAPAAGGKDVPRAELKVVKADSEETAGEDGKAANAIDGDKETIWHTQWQDANPPCPHYIILDLGKARKVCGLKYLPRQGDIDNGMIKDYEIYVSDSKDNFGEPVTKGTMASGKEEKKITFTAKQGQYVKLLAKSEMNDQAWTSVAELGVLEE